jgi:hypothetical protein
VDVGTDALERLVRTLLLVDPDRVGVEQPGDSRVAAQPFQHLWAQGLSQTDEGHAVSHVDAVEQLEHGGARPFVQLFQFGDELLHSLEERVEIIHGFKCTPRRCATHLSVATLAPMKICVSGKGGSGKTTVAGTLARLAGRSGRSVLAIDADSNPNLALTLGLGPSVFDEMRPLPHGLMEHKQVNGETILSLKRPVGDVTSEYSVECPDNVGLLLVGEVRGAASG